MQQEAQTDDSNPQVESSDICCENLAVVAVGLRVQSQNVIWYEREEETRGQANTEAKEDAQR